MSSEKKIARSKTKRAKPPLAERLKRAAQGAGFTSEALSERLGVTAGAVRSWWVGRNEPSVEMLQNYARETGVPFTELVADKSDERDRGADLLGELVDAYASGTLGQAWAEKRFGARVVRQSVEDPRFQQALNWLLTSVQEEFGRNWSELSPAERRSVLDNLVDSIRESLLGREPPPTG